MMDYVVLFLAAFLAATLLPFYSEVLVVALLMKQPEAWFWIWLVASVGNTLGSAANWALGRYLLRFRDRRWFPFKTDQLGRAQRAFRRYGVWSLLLAWAPIGGDALTFIAGVMRVPFGLFWILTFIGKTARYAVVLYLTDVTLL